MWVSISVFIHNIWEYVLKHIVFCCWIYGWILNSSDSSGWMAFMTSGVLYYNIWNHFLAQGYSEISKSIHIKCSNIHAIKHQWKVYLFQPIFIKLSFDKTKNTTAFCLPLHIQYGTSCCVNFVLYMVYDIFENSACIQCCGAIITV